MELKTIGSVFILQFNPVFTMAVASVALLIGIHVKKKSVLLEHLCLPVALIGGVFVILTRILLYYLFNTEISFDTMMLPYFFLAFFANIGLNASIALIRHGGMVLLYCVAACWGISVLQNVIGIGLAYLFGLHPTFGVLAGAASLAGGHGSALAFGSLLESRGIMNAEAVAVAAATFGVLVGSSLGSPLGKYLITRYHVKIETTHDHVYTQHLGDEARSGIVDPTKFLRMFAFVLICMALGSWIGELFNKLVGYSSITMLRNFKFPDYVWAMLMAVFIRNAGDAFNIFTHCADSLGLILSLSLRYAVVFVSMSLSIRDIHNVALPLAAILIIQAALVALIAIYGLFTLFGRDYDAAVICSGLCGLMIGASHSAMSNMSTVCEQHDKVHSHKAFLVVSLCGAALVDIFMLPFASICISMLL
ncbi:MAG: sodium:glutamate symporter [Synergistaceae bacterium]|nr:sodium:glutamate symporter [Synergistaceae bacterium]